MAEKNSIRKRSFMKNMGLVSAVGISNPQVLSIDSGERKYYRRLPYHSPTDEQMEKLRDFMLSKPYVQVFV